MATTDARLAKLEAATTPPAPPRARYVPESTDAILARHGVDLEAVAKCEGASPMERLACWLGVPYKQLMADMKARAANCPVNPAWDTNWWQRR